MTVQQERIQRFVDALRSGEHAQGFHGLFPGSGTACAVGVALRVMTGGHRVGAGILWSDANVLEPWYGFTEDDVAEIIHLNDTQRLSFTDIADEVYAKYLKEPGE